MTKRTNIVEVQALSALVGGKPACVWETRPVGYRVDMWTTYEDGYQFCTSSKDFRTLTEAIREERKMMA